MNKKVLLVHPGTQHVLRLAKQLNSKGLLVGFVTSIGWSGNEVHLKFIKKIFPGLYNFLTNRIIFSTEKIKVISYPFYELLYLIRKRFNKKISTETLLNYRNKKFQATIHNSHFKKCDVVIGYDTSSVIIASKAKFFKKKFVLDQTIAHPTAKEKVYNELKKRFSGWEDLKSGKAKELIDLEYSEHKLADRIVVASSFTMNSLITNGVEKEKITIIPYGVDINQFNFTERPTELPLIYLFVGSVNARKGVPFLIDCWIKSNIMNGELWIVGPISDYAKDKITPNKSIKIIGKVMHNQLQDLFAKAHVFVFPSFFEGFGLVILEAMATGLPVITTTATGGPDIMSKDEGFVLEPGNDEQMIQSLKYFSENREQIKIMGLNARKKAEKFTWEVYGEKWQELITTI